MGYDKQRNAFQFSKNKLERGQVCLLGLGSSVWPLNSRFSIIYYLDDRAYGFTVERSDAEGKNEFSRARSSLQTPTNSYALE